MRTIKITVADENGVVLDMATVECDSDITTLAVVPMTAASVVVGSVADMEIGRGFE